MSPWAGGCHAATRKPQRPTHTVDTRSVPWSSVVRLLSHIPVPYGADAPLSQSRSENHPSMPQVTHHQSLRAHTRHNSADQPPPEALHSNLRQLAIIINRNHPNPPLPPTPKRRTARPWVGVVRSENRCRRMKTMNLKFRHPRLHRHRRCPLLLSLICGLTAPMLAYVRSRMEMGMGMGDIIPHGRGRGVGLGRLTRLRKWLLVSRSWCIRAALGLVVLRESRYTI